MENPINKNSIVVACAKCNTPWAKDYLKNRSIQTTEADERSAREWEKLPFERKLDSPHREELEAAGWRHGKTIFEVECCISPNCKGLEERKTEGRIRYFGLFSPNFADILREWRED